jgi:hypothetical protein
VWVSRDEFEASGASGAKGFFRLSDLAEGYESAGLGTDNNLDLALYRLERLEKFLEQGAFPILGKEELEADCFRRSFS